MPVREVAQVCKMREHEAAQTSAALSAGQGWSLSASADPSRSGIFAPALACFRRGQCRRRGH